MDENGDTSGIGQEFYGKYTYDNLHQYSIEEAYPKIIKRIVEEQNNGNYLIEDPELIGDITLVLTHMIEIADKYEVLNEITCDIINEKTGTPFNLEEYAKYVDSHSQLSTIKTKKIISALGRKYVVVMGKAASMRKGKTDRLPFMMRVGQKLQFTKWYQEEDEHLKKKSITHSIKPPSSSITTE